MGMTPKENMLATLNHQPHDRIPNYLTDVVNGGFGFGNGPAFEKGPEGGGMDGFGVNWVCPATGGGAPIPEPGKFQLDSETIVDWKKIVKFPDVNSCDWEAQAKMELSRGNRDIQVVDFGSGNGPFERLAALMSIALEPEATADLLNAIVDYKIKVIEKAHEFYHPDLFTNYDDIATEQCPFMSRKAYQEIIKPAHKRIYDAAKAYDMIPVQHTCGKAESLVEDMIEIGVKAWTSVQPTNNIEKILQVYGDKLCIIGGYDTNGLPGRPDASPEVIKKEVVRDFEVYGKYSSYIFFGFLLENSLDPEQRQKRIQPLIEAAMDFQ